MNQYYDYHEYIDYCSQNRTQEIFLDFPKKYLSA